MPLDALVGLLGFGAFSIAFLGSLLFGVAEFIGRIYGTYRCLVRQDLTGEQRLIYLALIWFIPLGWAVYFLLGTTRTQHLFSEVDIL